MTPSSDRLELIAGIDLVEGTGSLQPDVGSLSRPVTSSIYLIVLPKDRLEDGGR